MLCQRLLKCFEKNLSFEVLLEYFELKGKVFSEKLRTESFDIDIAFTELCELGHSQFHEKIFSERLKTESLIVFATFCPSVCV